MLVILSCNVSLKSALVCFECQQSKWLRKSSSALECFQMPVMSSSAMGCPQVLWGAHKWYGMPSSVFKWCEVPGNGCCAVSLLW